MIKKEKGIGSYIFILIVLLILYYLVRFIPISKTSKNREDKRVEQSENIKKLRSTTDQLQDRVAMDKEAIDKFFFNEKTNEKILGLKETYPTDRKLKINDNLSIILQKEGNPIRIRLFDSEFEVINTRFNPSDDTDKMTQINDVVVVENPNDANHYQMIHYLRSYMVETYGQLAFDSYLDKLIANQIAENKELLDWIDQSYIEMEKVKTNE